MLVLKTIRVLALVFLSTQMVEASFNPFHLRQKSHIAKTDCRYANAFHAELNQSDAYIISLNPTKYPAAVQLSKKRNGGFKHNAILLTSKGVKVLKSGTYQVNYFAILFNESISISTPVTVSLIENNRLKSLPSHTLTASAIYLAPEFVGTAQGSAVLKIKQGTRLSLVASNGGYTPYTLKVFAWNISLSEIPSKK